MCLGLCTRHERCNGGTPQDTGRQVRSPWLGSFLPCWTSGRHLEPLLTGSLDAVETGAPRGPGLVALNRWGTSSGHITHKGNWLMVGVPRCKIHPFVDGLPSDYLPNRICHR